MQSLGSFSQGPRFMDGISNPPRSFGRTHLTRAISLTLDINAKSAKTEHSHYAREGGSRDCLSSGLAGNHPQNGHDGNSQA